MIRLPVPFPAARRRLALAAATSLLSLGLAGAAAAETLRVALNADIGSTFPGVNRDANTDTVVHHMFEGLVAFTAEGDVVPSLAQDMTVSDDGLTYTFTLPQGVTFHNGAPLTSADVVHAWEVYRREETEWRCQGDFAEGAISEITSITAADDHTVVFQLKQPSAMFLNQMARIDCGAAGIFHRDSLGADGTWAQPIGTGPFQLREWRQGEYIELKKFAGYQSRGGARDGYAGGREALVDAVRFVIVPDGAAARAALLAGDIHLLPDLAPADMATVQARSDMVVSTSPTMQLNTLLFQTRDEVLDDPRIRQAIALTLDRAAIVEALTAGAAPAVYSPIPVVSPFHGDPQAALQGQDLERARALLAEAGYNGEPIRLATTREYQSFYDQAVFAQAMAAQAGLTMELDVMDWATLLDRYSEGSYQFMSFGYSARLDPSLSFDMFMGDKDDSPRKVWDNPQAQALLQQSMLTRDATQRQALLDQLEAMYRDDMPMVTLYNPPEITAHSTAVEGYEAWLAGTPRLWGVSLTTGGGAQ